jgi:hypothetical protein
MNAVKGEDSPEIKVAEQGAKYFRGVRAAAKDPGVAIVAAQWEQTFEEELKRLRREQQQELALQTAHAA